MKTKLNIDEIIIELKSRGPSRVVVSTDGFAVSPSGALSEHTVLPDVIFVRNDGWTLGAPSHLESVAESAWSDEWRYVVRLPDYRVTRYRKRK